LLETGRGFYPLLAILLLANGWLLRNFVLQLNEGHQASGLGSQGAIWGITVANIIHLIGISHVGIAISAVVRLFNLVRYKMLARIAELVTLVCLTTAVVNIALDVGRPERFILNVALYGRWHSPLVWSMTVISTYLIASSIYLYLAMRRDLWFCARAVPQRAWLYRLLAAGYSDTEAERQTHERVLWWLALIILPIMVSVHSVYGWIIGLQVARPGWFNPLQAPYFVLGAIVSGFSAIIIVVAALRRIYRWEEFLPAALFRGLGWFLGFVTALYLYFLFSEQLTAQYVAPSAERAVSSELLRGSYLWLFWPTVIVGMVIPFVMLLIQFATPDMASVPLTVVASVFINLALWVKRFLIVVPSFSHPLLPGSGDIPPYHPSIHEWSLILGTYAFAILLYTLLVKLLPVMELPLQPAETPALQAVPNGVLAVRRRRGVLATLVVGVSLIAVGIACREHTLPALSGIPVAGWLPVSWFIPAPLLWVSGILVLLTLPLQLCLLSLRESPHGRERSIGSRFDPRKL